MKILVALHPCMDLGGIINHTEQLIGGLKDLGHDVDLKEFVWKTRVHGRNPDGNFVVGPSGIPHHQGKGWKFRSRDRVPYRGGALNAARQILKTYDIVIWTVPVPSKNKDNMGNHDWPALYDLEICGVKQIAFIHDGNASSGSLHLTAVQEHLSGLACVHPCAYEGSAIFTPPRELIVNPQYEPVREVRRWEDKKPGFVNMQTFKAWKHVHELIEAIAYMPPRREGELREVAGKGIEYQYMTSEDKCKAHYFHDRSGFAFERSFGGLKFWTAAVENGMVHHDYWSSDEVDEWLSHARVLVDPSWSKKYAAVGAHFNRVVVDAMIRGAIPVARRMGMGTDFFKPGEHYVSIAEGATPQEYADVVLSVGDMTAAEAQRYREAALEILPIFDRKKVAQSVIDLALEQSSTAKVSQQKMPSHLRRRAEDHLFDHFGVI